MAFVPYGDINSAVTCAMHVSEWHVRVAAPCQVVVTAGVAIASYGEINFVVIGVIVQLVSVATESTRLTLVQILLQV